MTTSSDRFTLAKILVWAKAYPEPSRRYKETVCTGGCLEDGAPVRLYPVPLRYLNESQQYSNYQWIEVPIEKNLSDPRPEMLATLSF